MSTSLYKIKKIRKSFGWVLTIISLTVLPMELNNTNILLTDFAYIVECAFMMVSTSRTSSALISDTVNNT